MTWKNWTFAVVILLCMLGTAFGQGQYNIQVEVLTAGTNCGGVNCGPDNYYNLSDIGAYNISSNQMCYDALLAGSSGGGDAAGSGESVDSNIASVPDGAQVVNLPANDAGSGPITIQSVGPYAFMSGNGWSARSTQLPTEGGWTGEVGYAGSNAVRDREIMQTQINQIMPFVLMTAPLAKFGPDDLVMGLHLKPGFSLRFMRTSEDLKNLLLLQFRERVGGGGGMTVGMSITPETTNAQIWKYIKMKMDWMYPGARIRFNLEEIKFPQAWEPLEEGAERFTDRELQYIREWWGSKFGPHNVSWYVNDVEQPAEYVPWGDE